MVRMYFACSPSLSFRVILKKGWAVNSEPSWFFNSDQFVIIFLVLFRGSIKSNPGKSRRTHARFEVHQCLPHQWYVSSVWYREH